MIEILYLRPMVGQSKKFAWADEELKPHLFDKGGINPARLELGTLLSRYEGRDLCILAARMGRMTESGIALLKWLAPGNLNIVDVPVTSHGLKYWLQQLTSVAECIGAADLRHGEYRPGWIEHIQATCLHGIDPSYEGFGLCL